MTPWMFVIHSANFAWPALAVAALLVPGVVGWRGLALWGQAARRFWQAWVTLFALGLVVLVAGMVYFGRDGKMMTYAALVVVTGTVASWLRSRR